MLKPIPQENPEEIRKTTAKKARKFMASGPGVFGLKKSKKPFSGKLNRKMQVEGKKDGNIVKSVCLKMIRFIQRNGQLSRQEITDLIYGLKRSVLSLEREQQRTYNKEQRKKHRP
jgi:hypothetical protein